MFEPTDNEPMEWMRRVRGRLVREMISEGRFKRQLREFAKFAVAQALNSTLDYDEIVEAWLAQAPSLPSPKSRNTI